MTTETKTVEKLTCTVEQAVYNSGTATGKTTFVVVDGEPHYKSGPGYIDGMLGEFSKALERGRWYGERWGYPARLTQGKYTYEFKRAD